MIEVYNDDINMCLNYSRIIYLGYIFIICKLVIWFVF